LRPFSQKKPFAERELMIQGHSVRQIWGLDEPGAEQDRGPIRRAALSSPPPPPAALTVDQLRLRLAEELDYARRMLGVSADDLSADAIAVTRHGLALQSLDIVAQMLGHLAQVVRAADQHGAVEEIGMADLRARLRRSGAL
jgi:hypothetical protein